MAWIVRPRRRRRRTILPRHPPPAPPDPSRKLLRGLPLHLHRRRGPPRCRRLRGPPPWPPPPPDMARGGPPRHLRRRRRRWAPPARPPSRAGSGSPRAPSPAPPTTTPAQAPSSGHPHHMTMEDESPIVVKDVLEDEDKDEEDDDEVAPTMAARTPSPSPAPQMLGSTAAGTSLCADVAVEMGAPWMRAVSKGEKSGIKKRHFHYTEQTIAEHPEFRDRAAPSLNARLGITQDAVPELAAAAAAAARAIAEWGRPATDITHLVVTTNSSAHAPGADLRLAALLGLRPTVQRTLLYLHGCFGGCSALRVPKDLAENNHSARVLVASSEVSTLLAFRGPDEAHLVAMALFGDGAGAAVISAGDPTPVERPVFYMVSASQATLTGTEHALSMQLGTSGLDLGTLRFSVAPSTGAWRTCWRHWDSQSSQVPSGMASSGLCTPAAVPSWTAARPR
ncbi:uncharacterized protein [Miscanthus floridulus]|uniref:uncharacterized protein n=1 Tax=Miscanthus floridulus TaxID=154761 RepID=UPI00345783CA